MWLFLIFVLVPLIEIGLFIQVGGLIGLWPTLLVVVVTAVAGTSLMRAQGLATLAELQSQLNEGRNPTGTIAHGALILVAGVLLLTPGFFTDMVGFLLLLPPVREAVIRFGATRLASRVTIVRGGAPGGTRPQPADDVIDADFEPVDEDDDASRPRGQSGWTKPR